MEPETQTYPVSKKSLWAGRVMSAVVVLFLLFDSSIHLMNPSFVVEAMTRLGYSDSIAPILGAIELVCLLLYVVPRTSVLGAVVLTGYLGGAIATNLRVANPLFSNTLFPVYLGILLWGGLYLRNLQLRALVSFRRNPAFPSYTTKLRSQ